MKFEGDIKILGLSVPEIGVGGLAGRVEERSIVGLKISKETDISDNDRNALTSNVSIGVYVYGTGINIYAGGIIGRDKANGNHSIAYTKSNISIAGFAFDLSSSQGTKTITETDTEYTTTYTRTASETTYYKLSAAIQISIGSGSTSSSGSRIYLLDFGTQET